MAKTTEKIAVIETGGKQYLVEEGTIISVEKLDASKKTIEFKQVLLISDNGNVELGTPYLDSSVKAEVLAAEEKDKKVRVFKFKKKTGYKKTQGHRQRYTTVKITSIGKKSTKAAPKKTETKKTETKASKSK